VADSQHLRFARVDRLMAKRQGPGRPGRGARRRWTAVAVVIGTVVVAGVGYGAYWAMAALPGQYVLEQGRRHIPTLDTPHEPYSTDPPTSGPHVPWLAPWGVHARPVPLPLQVHNLEDGGVMMQYNCECPELVEQLEAVVRRYAYVILAPYPAMKHRIALTAWTRIDSMQEFDERRIVRFIEAYAHGRHH
jgi:hypothetical protein